MSRNYRCTVLLLIYYLLGTASLAAAQPATGPISRTTDLPSVEAIKSCMNRAEGAECLDNLFREALKTHSTLEVLQLIQRGEAEDADLRRDCHPVVHAIGRETFRIKGNIHDSFSACDQTCHSGCYHGSVERFLRGDNIYSQIDQHPSTAELKQKAAVACDPNIPVRLYFQCLHGLGHALLFFSRYRLAPSLEVCDVITEAWARNSCYGGVFMENVSNSTPESRDLSATDYHYPCNKLDPKYRAECYVMQTSRMTEMGLSPERIFQECENAAPYVSECTLSIGRDLSNFVRAGDIRGTTQKCELGTGPRRAACVRGVVYALIDNTWDGRYALPFCAALSEEPDRADCFQTGAQYLRSTFEKSSADIANDCARYLSQPARCIELSARPAG